MQRIDFPAALAPVLGVDLAGERERQGEGGFQVRLAPDAPADIAGDPAELRIAFSVSIILRPRA